jgi:hypothetical protein
MTLPHFSVSSAMCMPKSAGEPTGVDLLVELLDDLCGRGLGCADAVPLARLVEAL